MTYTYAILDVSPATYADIRARLEAAGYQHAFDGDVIDMHGLAVKAAVPGDDGPAYRDSDAESA